MSFLNNRTVLKFRNVSYDYGHAPVLSNITFEVNEGGAFVVVGKCGEGKSTLLKLCSGLLTPKNGEILLMGENTKVLSRQRLLELRKNIGYVFQNSALISNQTIFENIAIPLRYHSQMDKEKIVKIVRNHMELVGVEGYAYKRPASLPADARKRAAMARALVMHPSLMLYDEPTSGLDPINSKAVKEIIKSMHSGFGITSVIVTHDVQLAVDLNAQVAVIKKGSFLFLGSTNDFLKNRNIYIREFVKN